MERYLTPKLLAGIACGWCTYPTDSKECGYMFHMEPEKTPFGKVMEVDSWQPEGDLSDSFDLMTRLKISVIYAEKTQFRGTLIKAHKIIGETKWERNLLTSGDTDKEVRLLTMQAIFEIAVAIGKTMPVPACMSMLLPIPEVDNETK